MSLENSEKLSQENEALKKRVAELECEVKHMKAESTTTEEVSISLPDHLYEFILDTAKEEGIDVEDWLGSSVMKFIYEITPYYEAFGVKDVSKLSKARAKLWSYLEPRCDLMELFSLMAKAEISPNEYNQLNDRSEKSYQTTIGLMIELLTKPRNEGGKAPFDSESLVIQRISEKAIYGQGKTKLGERFKDAKDRLTDEKKKTVKTTLGSSK